MKNNVILPARDDIEGFDLLLQAVDECAVAAKEEVAPLYWIIGRVMLDNVHRLNIDEDMVQLLSIARSMACEALTPSVRAQCFGGSCWSTDPREHCPPYMLKVDGRSRSSSEIRPEDRQIVAMVHLFAHHLMRDPSRVASAQALLLHESSNGLWTEDDFVDRE